MRRIETKKDVRKKKKRNQILIGIVLIIVMFGSVFGIVSHSFSGQGSNPGTIEYNGYEFINHQGHWYLNIGELEFLFFSNPLEIENLVDPLINGTLNPFSNYFNKPLYFSSSDSGSEVELARNLGQVAERFQRACLSEEGCEENLPIRSCLDNFIIIHEGNFSEIRQEGNCVFITGESQDLVRLTDDFLLRIIGVK